MQKTLFSSFRANCDYESKRELWMPVILFYFDVCTQVAPHVLRGPLFLSWHNSCPDSG